MDYLFLSGDQASADFLSRLIFWIPKTNNPDGWVYKTQDEWEMELGLSPKRQRTIRKKLRELGIIQERKIGIPCQLQYKVNFDVIDKLKEKFQPIAKLKKIMAQIKNKWQNLLCRGLSQIARNFCQEIKSAITIGLKDISKISQLEKQLSNRWKEMNEFTNDPNKTKDTINIPGTHTNTLHHKRKIALQQTTPNWANYPDAPWTPEEWQKFAQALLQYAAKLKFQNPTGFINKVADNTNKIGTSVEWQEFSQGHEIGSLIKADWEYLRGIPYPAFTQYAARQLQKQNMSLEQATRDLGNILKFNPNVASELWQSFSRKIVNAEKEVEQAKKNGITPSVPPELKTKPQVTPAESAMAYKRLMAITQDNVDRLERSNKPQILLEQAQPRSQAEEMPELNHSSQIVQAEATNIFPADISSEQQAKNRQRLLQMMKKVGKTMKHGKKQSKVYHLNIEKLNAQLTDPLLRADPVYQAQAKKFLETGAEAIEDDNGLICQVMEVEF